MPTTLQEIEAAFPDLVAQIRSAARDAAFAEVRELVARHLRFGERARDAGGLRRAHKAILTLEPMTEALMEEYLRFAMSQRRIDDRQADSDAAGEVLDGFTGRTALRSEDSSLAAEIDRQLGGAT
jgi:hypothetical protein